MRSVVAVAGRLSAHFSWQNVRLKPGAQSALPRRSGAMRELYHAMATAQQLAGSNCAHMTAV